MADTQGDPQIQDAEIVAENETAQPEVEVLVGKDETTLEAEEALFDEENFQAVQNLVSRKAAQADELHQQIKELNESLKNILINDIQLSEAEEQAKESRKVIQQRKKELASTPESISIKAKLQELKDELADVEDGLSTQLLNLYQLTGVQEFETNDGQVREFVIKARVKSKKAKA